MLSCIGSQPMAVLSPPWSTMLGITLLFDLKYSIVKMIDMPIIFGKYQIKGIFACEEPSMKKRGRCHIAQTIPIKTLERNGLYNFSSFFKANPRQPGSSWPPPKKKTNITPMGYRIIDGVWEKSIVIPPKAKYRP